MLKDSDSILLTSQEYKHALNANIESFDGSSYSIQNEASNLLITKLSSNVVGYTVIPSLNICILFTTDNKGNDSIIALKDIVFNDDDFNYKLGESTPLEKIQQIPIATENVVTLCQGNFNWNIINRVNIKYKITDCTLNLYFVDGVNPDRFIYFNLDYSLHEDFKNSSGVLDVNKTKFNQSIIFPDIKLTTEVGGTLIEGVYQIYVAYSTSKGIPLSSFIGTNVFPIFNNVLKTIENNEYSTTKAIKIDITNTSKSSIYYKYITIVVASTINGNTSYNQVATLPITDTTTSYLYTGNKNNIITKSEAEILVKNPLYKNSSLIEVSNNYLFRAGLNEYEKFNIQRIANKLTLEAVTIKVEEDYYKHAENNINKTYLRDEVYAFGIEFILDEGEITGVGHIPNRLPNNNDLATIINVSDKVGSEQYNWQVNNTSYKTSSPHNNEVWETFDFGYWESTEKYPNNTEIWETNANTPIRLHKFPDCSISHIHDGENINVLNIYNKKTYLFPIGIRLKSNLISVLNEAVQEKIITLEQRKRIRGYRIVKADRAGNKSIIAKGLLYDMWSYEKTSIYNQDDDCSIKTKYYYPNYGFNDLRDDPFISSNNNHYKYSNFEKGLQVPTLNKFNRENKYTFHSPDTHFAQPSLGNILKLETEEYGESKGFFSVAEEQARYKLLTNSHYSLATLIARFIVGNTDVTSQNSSSIGTSIGSTLGGVAGSFIPGIGTSVGSLVGGLVGSFLGSDDDVTREIQKNALILHQAEKLVQLFKNLTDYKKLQYQYQAIGKYKGYKALTNNGNRQRLILNSAYLKPTKQSINGTLINNTFRESSIYLDVNALLPNCTLQDTSRFSVNQLVSSTNLLCLKYRLVITKLIDNTGSGIYVSYQNCLGESVTNVYSSNTTAVYDIYASTLPQIRIAEDVGINNVITELTLEPCPECSQFNVSKYTCKCKGQEITSNISSYYASIKVNKANQYGSILGMSYIDTHDNYIPISNNPIIFGGDTYIVPFALKRKHAFFNNTTFGLSDETDIFYEDLGNVGYPTYYFNTAVTDKNFIPSFWLLNNLTRLFTLGVPIWSFWQSVSDFFGLGGNEEFNIFKNVLNAFANEAFNVNNFMKAPSYYLDCGANNPSASTLNIFSFEAIEGMMYLYNYGIPYFYCESDVNTFYRVAKNNKDLDFYPNNEDLNNWLQEKNVPISVDNFYFYDRTYSKQAKENFHYVNDINFKPYADCKIQYPNRVIYSLQSSELDNSDLRDNYLINKPLDYYDFSQVNGKLTGIHGIESDKVLVMFENNMQIFSAFNTLETEQGLVQIGNGGIFRSKPQEFSKSLLGYSGSQNSSFVSTEFGHIFVDTKRGDVFLIGSNGNGLNSLTKDKMRNWFRTYLPFNIIKYFPEVNIDNTLNNIGITLGYDKRFNRLFLTKLDYIPKDKNITYNSNLHKFYLGSQEVSVTNSRYFTNVSFTIAYSFITNSWISFYSFTPNFYLENVNYFITGKNNNLWGHGLTNKSYQVFNGVLCPFEIELTDKYSYNHRVLQSVSYQLDTIRYFNNQDRKYKPVIGFNKAVIYNNNQSTGLLELEKVNPKDLYKCKQYPIIELYSSKIIQSNKENIYSFNQFKDRCKPSEPLLILHKNGVNSVVNPNSITTNNSYAPIRGNINYIKLINDKHSNYKMIFKLANFNQTNSIR